MRVLLAVVGWVVGAGVVWGQSMSAAPAPLPQPGYRVEDAGDVTIEYMPISAGTAELAEEWFHEVRDHVEERLGVVLPERPHVVIAPTDEEFARRYADLAGGPPTGFALAVAFPLRNVTIFRESGLRADVRDNFYETLRHELAHLALGPLDARSRLPRWLHEGLAEFAASRPLTSQEAAQIESWAKYGQLPDFADLTDTFPAHHGASQRAYTIALAFVTWLDQRPPGDGVRRLLDRLEEGAGLSEAVESVSGEGLWSTEIAWKAELADRADPWRTGWSAVQGLTVWSVAALLAVLAIGRHAWRQRRLRRRLALEDLEEDAAAAAEEAREAGFRVLPPEDDGSPPG